MSKVYSYINISACTNLSIPFCITNLVSLEELL